MHVKRRRLPNFESCSVALFTSLALGGAALPARSQTPSTPPITSTNSTVPPTTSTVRSTPTSGTSNRGGPTHASTAITPSSGTPERLAQVFKRTDVNSDGQLSREEAAAWPGMSLNFDHIDSNKDGSVSSAEFDEALK
jgi:hypothetical protein